jgi:L-fuconolactonase
MRAAASVKPTRAGVLPAMKGPIVIVDTHVHVFTDDRKKYPQTRDTARAGSVPSIKEIGQTEWTLTTAENLMAEMDKAGIDKATLVQAYFVYEYDNRYTIDCALAHPDRFASVVVLDPLDKNAPDELSRLAEKHDAAGFRFMRGRLPQSSLGDAATFPLWERLQSLKLPVAISERIGEYHRLAKVTERYPDVKICFEHSWGHEVGTPPYPKLDPLFAFAGNPNIYVKTAINNIGAARDAGGTPRQLYEKLLEVFGAKRIMWSSNYPAHPRFGSLKERVDISKQELAFLSKEEQDWIFGKTALSVFPRLRS